MKKLFLLVLLAVSSIMAVACSDDSGNGGRQITVVADASPSSAPAAREFATVFATGIEVLDMKLYVHSMMLRNPDEVIACFNDPEVDCYGNACTTSNFSIFDNENGGSGVVISPNETKQSLAFSVLEESSITVTIPQDLWDIATIHISYVGMGTGKESTITYKDPHDSNKEKTVNITALLSKDSGNSFSNDSAYGIIWTYGDAASKIPNYSDFVNNSKTYLGNGVIQELVMPDTIDTRVEAVSLTLQLDATDILKDNGSRVYIDQPLLEQRLNEMLSIQ